MCRNNVTITASTATGSPSCLSRNRSELQCAELCDTRTAY